MRSIFRDENRYLRRLTFGNKIPRWVTVVDVHDSNCVYSLLSLSGDFHYVIRFTIQTMMPILYKSHAHASPSHKLLSFPTSLMWFMLIYIITLSTIEPWRPTDRLVSRQNCHWAKIPFYNNAKTKETLLGRYWNGKCNCKNHKNWFPDNICSQYERKEKFTVIRLYFRKCDWLYSHQTPKAGLEEPSTHTGSVSVFSL